jgi:hypothetical protein
MEIPSVEVDADLDNHEIEAQICRNWLISEAGRLARFDRPEGYRNVLLHYKQHLQFRQLQMMEQAAQAGQLPPDEEAGKETSKKKGTNGSGMAPQENEESDGSRATIQ